MFGPHISGDSLDVFGDLVMAGSNRNKEVVQLFSLNKRQLIANVDWESGRKDLETGFVFGARFTKPNPNMIIAGGAGKNEVKIFENNCDGSASYRVLASLNDLDAPCLSLDVTRNGETFAFGCQDGRIFVCSTKLEESVEFEGYQGGSVEHLAQSKVHPGGFPEEDEERKE